MALASSFPFLSLTEQSFLKSSLHPSTSVQCPNPQSSRRNSSLLATPSKSVSDKALSDILNSGMIACLRAKSPELAWEAASAALNGGVAALEIVMSTPGVLEVLQQLVLEYPGKTIGVGTVLNAKDARHAIDCGAKFLMSPAISEVSGTMMHFADVMQYVSGSKVLYIPGVMTPTEILSAYNAGARIVKVYPISAIGGAKYVAAVRKPFPHIPLVASQGITIDLIEEYISQGAAAVVLSDAIFQKLTMGEKNFEGIYQVANEAALLARESVESYRKLLTGQAGK